MKNWFLFLVIIIFAIGIFFRFIHIDRKVYWHDEVYTSLRVSGYDGDRVRDKIFNGQLLSPEDLLKFQRLSPEKSLKDTFNALIEHPEHPPLYYLIARFWLQLFGSSITAIRSLSVFFSLLVFPLLYWLCWELFGTSVVGWYAIALVAISPFHVLYAQEAREYSLWTATILLCSASLIRAMKTGNWGLYALSLALNFYVTLLSIFLPIGYSIYVFGIEGFRWTKKVKSFCLASLVGTVMFVPWLLAIYYHFPKLQDKTSWTNIKQPFSALFWMWQLHLNSIFLDLHPRINGAIAPILFPLLLILVGYSIYFLCRYTPKHISLFVVTLIAVTSLGLILPDAIFGGQKSSMTRYFIPSYLGIQIAVAYYLSQTKFSQSKISSVIFAVLITVGIISCVSSSQADTWWNKVTSYHNGEIAKIINNTDNPLIISDDYDINQGNLISLSYFLEQKVKLLLVKQPNIPQISKGFSDVFILNNSEAFLSGIQQKNKVTLDIILGGPSYSLWKISNF